MDSEELKKRTKAFAHRCVKVALTLPKDDLGRVLRGQLIRCTTSTAANYRAVCLAQSTSAFISKVSIVLEECDESWFWQGFIIDEGLLIPETVKPLQEEAHELTSIFAASRRTATKGKAL
ncbi:MAG: four helix bundle protein [Verrucomicrobia bacterium]|nr:four helix bundle protein [Verrucomicrobiota bacterium]